MNDKIEKKYLEDKRRKYYGGTKNDALYLFRQSRKEHSGAYLLRALPETKPIAGADPKGILN
jgi:hypothetical protein